MYAYRPFSRGRIGQLNTFQQRLSLRRFFGALQHAPLFRIMKAGREKWDLRAFLALHRIFSYRGKERRDRSNTRARV
jgi:hypothetical protein